MNAKANEFKSSRLSTQVSSFSREAQEWNLDHLQTKLKVFKQKTKMRFSNIIQFLKHARPPIAESLTYRLKNENPIKSDNEKMHKRSAASSPPREFCNLFSSIVFDFVAFHAAPEALKGIEKENRLEVSLRIEFRSTEIIEFSLSCLVLVKHRE